MHYALLIYAAPDSRADTSATTGSAVHGPFDEWIGYTRALKDAHALLNLARLQSVETATSVRMRDGERILTDGPFVETKEHLLGFYLVEAPNLDGALDLAARMPLSRYGVVEVRPVMPTPMLTQIVQE